MESRAQRSRPNILITGTPGCGKSTICELVKLATGLVHVEVGTIVKEYQCYEGRNEEFDCFILDEDKLLSILTPQLQQGGNLIDFHTSYAFPEDVIDLIIVLRTDNSVLYERLENRKYAQNKISENIEAEIMQVCLDEARENFDPDIVHELQSNTPDEMEQNTMRIIQWIESWRPHI